LILGGTGPAGRVVVLVEYHKSRQKTLGVRKEGLMKVAFVTLVVLVGASHLAVASEQTPKFKITTKGNDDSVEAMRRCRVRMAS
jgi:hypothetical protein